MPVPKLFDCTKLSVVNDWATPATGTSVPSSCRNIPSENSGSIDTHLIPLPSLFKKKLFAPGDPDES